MEKQKIAIPEGANRVIITYEQLKESKTFADAYGLMPKQHPLEHHAFITKIMAMINNAGYEASVGIMYADVKSIMKISKEEAEAKGLDQDDADNTLIKNLIGTILIGNEKQLEKQRKDNYNIAIAFVYSDAGITIAFGTNVSICGNFSIYGADNIYKNFGSGSTTVNEMFNIIDNWIKELKETYFQYTQLFELLLERRIEMGTDWNSVSNEFIGETLKLAVKKNYHKGDYWAFNMTQANKLCSQIIAMDDETEHSLYDLYQAGTYVLTHMNEMDNIFKSIRLYTNWFIRKYNIDIKEYQETEKEAEKPVQEPQSEIPVLPDVKEDDKPLADDNVVEETDENDDDDYYDGEVPDDNVEEFV